MVREGDNQVVEALNARLEIEPSHYERVVILESLACSQDDGYIRGYVLYIIEIIITFLIATPHSSYFFPLNRKSSTVWCPQYNAKIKN